MGNTPPDTVNTCQNTYMVLQHSQDLLNRSQQARTAEIRQKSPPGAVPMTRDKLKLEDIHPGDIPNTFQTSPPGLGIWPAAEKNCARGSPPKSRYSGHQNSRLMRGASKHVQTKCLSYYMGKGWKDKLKGSVRLNCRVIGVILWLHRNQ